MYFSIISLPENIHIHINFDILGEMSILMKNKAIACRVSIWKFKHNTYEFGVNIPKILKNTNGVSLEQRS